MWNILFRLLNQVAMEEMIPMTETRQELGITDEQVAVRAFEIFADRGGEHGRDVEDWLLAEAELVGEADVALVALEEEAE